MGHHNRVFIGDPHALEGAWSPPNSKANFCEEDYAISFYIAEFINSLTNLFYVFLALRYMYGPGSRGLFSPKSDFMSVSLIGVGVASFLFHATLRQNLQFADDLSMLVLSWALCQPLLTAKKSPQQTRLIAVCLGSVFFLFSAFYIWSRNIVYHTSAFGITLILIAFRIRYLFYWRSIRFPESKTRNWSIRTWQAIGMFLFGYLIWNIDLEFCLEMRRFRAWIGMPWAFLFEFHGWWHIFTGLGANHFMTVVREMCEEMEHEKED